MNTQDKLEEKCMCACHDTEWNTALKHSPVEHERKCCEKMNGYLEQGKEEQAYRKGKKDGLTKAVEIAKIPASISNEGELVRGRIIDAIAAEREI